MGRRRPKRRLRGALFIIAIALLIAGFMIRRLMVAGVIQRPGRGSPSAPSYADNPNPQREHISNTDRERLNQVLKEKSSGGH